MKKTQIVLCSLIAIMAFSFTTCEAITPVSADALDNTPLNAYRLIEEGDMMLDAFIQEINEAIRLEPNDVSGYLNRSYLHFYRGRYDLAIEDLNKCMELSPGDAHDLYIYYRGFNYFHNGDYDLAIADYSVLLKNIHNNGILYYSRGEAYKKKGDMIKAEADFARAKELGIALQ